MAHYVPSKESNRVLNDHPIYWMESGGQYFGCSTDNTVCLALGKPEPRHVRAHTLVIKGWVAPLQAGMIVSNEPAYYRGGDFGIRVESHMVTIPSTHAGFLEFQTLSRLPIDPKLIDPSLLTGPEKRWLADYHVKIADDYRDDFDRDTASWLQKLISFYIDLDRV